MNLPIEKAVTDLRIAWNNLTLESRDRIKEIIETLARDPEVIIHLQNLGPSLALGLEIYRDQKYGFVLIAYSEEQGHYRIPHNHGEAWVVYAVVSGQVEMGHFSQPAPAKGQPKIIQNGVDILSTGNTQIYLQGEIHDTRCISKYAIILRLTSHDLREEERAGRMVRFQI